VLRRIPERVTKRRHQRLPLLRGKRLHADELLTFTKSLLLFGSGLQRVVELPASGFPPAGALPLPTPWVSEGE
jgi:hypothetical protein